MPVMIGGEKAWKKRAHGDIGVSFQWVNGEQSMILFPLHRRTRDAGAFVIGISAMHLYAQANGYPNLHTCIPRAMEAARTMDMGQDKATVRRIVEIILDSLPDLAQMPPEPDWVEREVQKAQNIGELTIKQGDRVLTERVVTDLDSAEMAGTA